MRENTLNIIGCGRLGKTLARLFLERKVITLLGVRNRSDTSSRRAIEFLKSGQVASSVSQLPRSRLWMICTPDEEISVVARELREASALQSNDLVFHCSGALSSRALAPLRELGAVVASVHPIRSFADPASPTLSFEGTRCAFEGDSAAREGLSTLFESIGGGVFEIATDAKLLLHAGHVFASNYVVSVLECANRLYTEAGVDPELAREFMRPLVGSVVDNIERLGTVRALTGPIARGESELVATQLAATRQALPDIGELYARLGEIAADLAERQGLSPERAQATRRALLKTTESA